VKVYLESAGKFAADNAYIRNKAGRMIKYKPPKSEKERAAIAREGKNNQIQSLNTGITKLAMGRLYTELLPYKAKLINVVHDELVFEVPGEHAEIAAKLIKEEMEAAGREFLQFVPVVVSFGIIHCN
jgi:DNA polymerase I-like protein with 3'-5' exonuclease and polymerase domains